MFINDADFPRITQGGRQRQLHISRPTLPVCRVWGRPGRMLLVVSAGTPRRRGREPVRRMARATGNAVVPQIAFAFGKAISNFEKEKMK